MLIDIFNNKEHLGRILNRLYNLSEEKQDRLRDTLDLWFDRYNILEKSKKTTRREDK
jgi:hypothetical protein